MNDELNDMPKNSLPCERLFPTQKIVNTGVPLPPGKSAAINSVEFTVAQNITATIFSKTAGKAGKGGSMTASLTVNGTALGTDSKAFGDSMNATIEINRTHGFIPGTKYVITIEQTNAGATVDWSELSSYILRAGPTPPPR